MERLMKLEPFEKSGIGKIRIALLNSDLMFNLYDTCFYLGYTKKNTKGKEYLFKDRIENICKALDISGVYITYTNKNNYSVPSSDSNKIVITKNIDFENTWIDEQSFYDLCLESHAKNARPFRRWVTGEVLPSIRKTGFYSTGKAEQPKIEAPRNIVKKFYNGSSVMVLKDLESILSVPVGNLSYYLRNNSSFKRGIDYFLLEGKELKRFKEYNKVSPFIGNLIIMPKQGVDKLIKLLVLSKKHIQEIEEYFKVETKDPYNNMPIIEQLQVCKFIADDFKINEAIKMSIYKMICQKNGIGSEIVGMISIEETRDKFVKLAVEYLNNFTTDVLIKAKRELIFRDEFISSPHETKGLILGFFDIVIEISKKNTKTAV